MALRIGELARQAGVRTSALRYYEEAGLLRAAARTEAGYRTYPATALVRLSFIKRAQALGLSIREIRELIAALDGNGDLDWARVRQVVANKLVEADQRIHELRQLRKQLAALLAQVQRAPDPDCDRHTD
jgi:DNA-binding transcriptional MerR regulator